MQIGIDHGSGERTVLLVQAAKKGVTFRAIALQVALRGLGRHVSIDDCMDFARNGGPVCLEDYPRNPTQTERGDG